MAISFADIVLVNRSTVLQDHEIEGVIPAFQAQVTDDWAPHWPANGPGTKLHFAGRDAPVPQGLWPLFILDHTDVPGAGGYHDDDAGLVQGKVFAGDAMQYGEAWTVDATHELLEMLGDPTADIILPIPYTQLHCYQEVCDAVEADRYAYPKNGHLVTDFVLPGYFTGKGGPHFDFAGHLIGHVPTLLHGGYLAEQQPNGQWTQIVKRDAAGNMSRRAMRSHRIVKRMGLASPFISRQASGTL
jgi:hypothetical protein